MLSDAGVEMGSNYEWPIISIEESRSQVTHSLGLYRDSVYAETLMPTHVHAGLGA